MSGVGIGGRLRARWRALLAAVRGPRPGPPPDLRPRVRFPEPGATSGPPPEWTAYVAARDPVWTHGGLRDATVEAAESAAELIKPAVATPRPTPTPPAGGRQVPRRARLLARPTATSHPSEDQAEAPALSSVSDPHASHDGPPREPTPPHYATRPARPRLIAPPIRHVDPTGPEDDQRPLVHDPSAREPAAREPAGRHSTRPIAASVPGVLGPPSVTEPPPAVPAVTTRAAARPAPVRFSTDRPSIEAPRFPSAAPMWPVRITEVPPAPNEQIPRTDAADRHPAPAWSTWSSPGPSLVLPRDRDTDTSPPLAPVSVVWRRIAADRLLIEQQAR